MSKSLKRVEAAIADFALEATVLEMDGETKTALQAAEHAGCELDQIAKSIIFQGATSDQIYLFVTAGRNMVDPIKAAAVAGETLERADGKLVRKVTRFAIGGVSPIGHLTAPRLFFDPKLLEFETVWAAAGTPRHMFSVKPADLQRACGSDIAHFTLDKDI